MSPHSDWFKIGSIVTDNKFALVRTEGGGHIPRGSVCAAWLVFVNFAPKKSLVKHTALE